MLEMTSSHYGPCDQTDCAKNVKILFTVSKPFGYEE